MTSMISRIENFFRRLRRSLSRSEWYIRLVGASRREAERGERGVVLIQIDGLAEGQFRRSLERGNCPFLRRLMERESHVIRPMYSGLPSNTPGVQGELFYGVKSAVPAFSFRDRGNRRIMRMFDSDAAGDVENELRSRSERSLLENGSAYSDVFVGGAAESHFCASSMRWNELARPRRLLSFLMICLFNAYGALRTAACLAIEVLLAVVDCGTGMIYGHNFLKELKFIPSRVAICVMLRELIVIRSKIDVARGLPIVHVNFLGYDEQAHRRGPSSDFAHWTLKGIDDAVKRIWRAAKRSHRRDYEVLIYSDHGQEDCLSYAETRGRSIADAVRGTVSEELGKDAGLAEALTGGIQFNRIRHVIGAKTRWLFPKRFFDESEESSGALTVAAMGPEGHVYLDEDFDEEAWRRVARKLVDDHGVPTVFVKRGADGVNAFNEQGEFVLPDQKEEVFGADHPFLSEVAADMTALIHHPHAGDVILSGWRPDGAPVSFPSENGSHGGPGRHETNGFVLVPQPVNNALFSVREGCPLSASELSVQPETCDQPRLRPDGEPRPPKCGKKTGCHSRLEAVVPRGAFRVLDDMTHLRPADLRRGVLGALDERVGVIQRAARSTINGPSPFRLVTYNIHSCRGMDGKFSPERVARALVESEPDIVALQEIDVEKTRSGRVNQARVIAAYLDMEYFFHPVVVEGDEQYGLAVLTHFPARLAKAGRLTAGSVGTEPRGAMSVIIDVDGIETRVINTHLGLGSGERGRQIEVLLGPDWLGSGVREAPTIFCGDFNASPRSKVYRSVVASGFRDAQTEASAGRPKNTWFSRFPTLRPDHVFIDESFDVNEVIVPDGHLQRLASDHLPVCVELEASK